MAVLGETRFGIKWKGSTSNEAIDMSSSDYSEGTDRVFGRVERANVLTLPQHGIIHVH